LLRNKQKNRHGSPYGRAVLNARHLRESALPCKRGEHVEEPSASAYFIIVEIARAQPSAKWLDCAWS
jgi:hypothetical protein